MEIFGVRNPLQNPSSDEAMSRVFKSVYVALQFFKNVY